MGIARNIARLIPNGSGELPTANLQDAGITRAKLADSAELQNQLFTSSGTFTVPAGVTKVFVTGCGGGGGGPSFWASGGGAGSWCMSVPVTVTPGQSISVTVGGGGALNNGGGTSSFGSFITMGGGTAGGGSGSSADYSLGGSLSFGSGISGVGSNGQGGKFSNHANAGHGEGGNTPFGQTGRNSDTSNSTNDGKGYGSGGHSGWGSSFTATGRDGFILVEW